MSENDERSGGSTNSRLDFRSHVIATIRHRLVLRRGCAHLSWRIRGTGARYSYLVASSEDPSFLFCSGSERFALLPPHATPQSTAAATFTNHDVRTAFLLGTRLSSCWEYNNISLARQQQEEGKKNQAQSSRKRSTSGESRGKGYHFPNSDEECKMFGLEQIIKCGGC